MGAGELVTAPICGWLADRTSSRRAPLLFGLLLQGGAIALFGISTSIWMLILSRVLSGMSSSIVYTVGLALVIDTVEASEVGQWMGTALSVANVGIVISPVIGGAIYARARVWGVLGFMIGLITLDVVLRLLVIEQKVAKRYYIEASESSYGTMQTEGHPNSSVGVPFLDGVLHNPGGRMKKLQMPPIFHLLRSPRVLSAWYGVFTQVGLLVSFESILPLFVQRTFGWSSLGAGLIFLALGIPCAFGPLVGKLSDRYGPRHIALIGCFFVTPPIILLRLVERDSQIQKTLLCVLLVLYGFFSNFVVTSLGADMSAATDQMTAERPEIFGQRGAYAQVTALFESAMAASALVGSQISGQALEHLGWANMNLILGIWFGSVALPVMFFTGNRKD